MMIDSTFKMIVGVIIKVNAALTGSPPAADPAATTYDVRGLFDLVSGKPVVMSLTGYVATSRVSVGAHIIPPEPGDPCWIVVSDTKVRLYVHETVPYEEACP